MATIGQVLTAPESGWSRHDLGPRSFKYTGDNSKLFYDTGASTTSYYNGTYYQLSENGSYIEFEFIGTKIQLTGLMNSTTATSVSMTIDGVTESFSTYRSSAQFQSLLYQKTGLTSGLHKVKLQLNDTKPIQIDSVDIDSTGEFLLIPIQVGEQLTSPEVGWKRYDDTHPAIKYEGTWNTSTVADTNGGSLKYSNDVTAKISFNFIGAKLRVIAHYQGSGYDNEQSIKVDGVSYSYSQKKDPTLYKVMVFELVNLESTKHTVEITSPHITYISIDAIDIDSDGRLLHPNEVLTIGELEVGKRIRAHYTATSNAVGAFSNLGEETYVDGINDFIPPASSATPNGDFYFIMVDEGNGKQKLIADRNIQHSISWDTLNSAGIASGSGTEVKIKDQFIDSNDGLIPNMIANTNPNHGTASTSTTLNSNYSSFHAFSDIKDISLSGTSGWACYQFFTPQIVNKYILSASSNNLTGMPKSWLFQGSNDGTNWVDLDSRSNETSWTSLQSRTYYFDNNKEFLYYRLNISSINGATWITFSKLQMLKTETTFKDFNASLYARLLTGGISSTDKDNEWDQYIVGSSLNGSITPGDNNVWNVLTFNQSSWTSSTSTESSTRVIRGSTSKIDNYLTDRTLYSSYRAFRPVLEIESIPSPPTFEGDVDRTSVKMESILLSGTAADPNNGLLQYSITVNGNELVALTEPAPSPLSIEESILNTALVLGLNTITLRVIGSTGEELVQNFTVTKEQVNKHFVHESGEYKKYVAILEGHMVKDAAFNEEGTLLRIALIKQVSTIEVV